MSPPIDDPDRFKHDRSNYERPSGRFRCGREATWNTPCHHGPNPDGSCGGTTECAPFKNAQGRYECRRPRAAGGTCAEGPRPDGACSQQHPPCQPTLTLRAWRGRFALIGGSLALALIGVLFVFGRDDTSLLSPIDPGPLSTHHAWATKGLGCVACHDAPHALGSAQWTHALMTTADLTPRCATCHALGGHPRLAHNRTFPARRDLGETTCIMCHTEHRGATAQLTRISDARCNACHTARMASFAADHPPFSKTFPSERRTAIQFDHVSHFGQHFKRRKFANVAPESCTTCHRIDAAQPRVLTLGSFEQTCATCHSADVQKNDLVLFRLPEFTRGIDRELVVAACGSLLEASPPGADAKVASAEPFDSVAYGEEPALITATLLGVAADDPEAFTEAIQAILLAMAREGAAPLAAPLDAYAASPVAANLLAGLNPDMVRRAACAWAANLEYEPSADAEYGGWHADLLELRYTPLGHADPVIQGWLEWVLDVPAHAPDETTRERAHMLRTTLTSGRRGVGRCTKCHAVTAVSDDALEPLMVEWTSRGAVPRPSTVFSHAPHLAVLGGEESCTTCHLVNETADYTAAFRQPSAQQFESNFHPIAIESCTQCHGAETTQPFPGIFRQAQGATRQDCLLCHTYHPAPRLLRPMTTRETKNSHETLPLSREDDTISRGDDTMPRKEHLDTLALIRE